MTAASGEASLSDQQQRTMRYAILAQCFGVLPTLLFINGFLLLYLTALGAGAGLVMVTLSFHEVFRAFLTLPGGWVADRMGQKRLGAIGLLVCITGVALLPAAGLLPDTLGLVAAMAGAALYATGVSLQGSSWFTLLRAAVPESVRGRFFGKLRFSWQIVGLGFTLLCGVLLSRHTPLWLFQILLLAILGGQVVRFVFYLRIPDMTEPAEPGGPGFATRVLEAIRSPNYLPFCSYVFLLAIFTVGAFNLFGLVEKTVLQWGDDTVQRLGFCAMGGMLCGFAAGGRFVDRYGSKTTFLACHFGYFAVLWAFVLRGHAPVPLWIYLATLHFLFGLIYAASSIAITTEMLALAPRRNPSLGIGVAQTLQALGLGLSQILAAGAIGLGMFEQRWLLLGEVVSDYDAILLIYGLLVGVTVVTLGLVPSVLHKSSWIPRT